MANKKIAIVGGGITGLYLGYRLSPKYQVTIFEKEANLGGLISTIKTGPGWPIENFYHHFFTSDKALINLLNELSLPYFFTKPITAVWQSNKVSSFSSPLDILTFPDMKPLTKIRFGLATLFLKALPSYRLIPENQSANNFFPKIMGHSAYQAIWQPLIKGKFGSYQDQVSAVWLWARIKTRSTRLGYPEESFSRLTQKLSQKIISQKGQIKTNQAIRQKNQLANFDKVIFTTPEVIMNRIYQNQGEASPHYLASLNLILSGPKSIIPKNVYWLNILDSSFPFVAIINQTGLVDPQRYGGQHLTYISGYYRQNDPILSKSAQEVLAKFRPFIKKINPHFQPDQYQAFLNKYYWAQSVPEPKAHLKTTSFQTVNDHVYLINMEKIFPWDRGVNYSILLADKFLASVALDE
ncbi:MAG: NAD(P)-binding protein [Candidatus Shapirobacteria bacterium]|nr:NAD(P)-binding protein [Candidatus Shapirobacteria bacterium]MDD5073625.1 NAD(P)-binding protein [Candidatus Shapirobacteria bacterium]MDD5481414.1 NAD(P)-binding protein [Candidatus Shapirobacteria bacterium]